MDGNVARMERGDLYTGFWWENLSKRDHLEDVCIERWMILKWIFRKWDFGPWIGLIWLGIGTGGGLL
jgi:hypothetical protein